MHKVKKIMLLLIPQRYEFSSKSQHKQHIRRSCLVVADTTKVRIFKQITTHLPECYPKYVVVADTTKVRIFKQITTSVPNRISLTPLLLIPQRYEFSSKSQQDVLYSLDVLVVADTTKVRIFKQITTGNYTRVYSSLLLLIPQRYEFSSKSQLPRWWPSTLYVVADTTKVRIFKQITTPMTTNRLRMRLLLIPQRYEFSSKSQQYRWDS